MIIVLWEAKAHITSNPTEHHQHWPSSNAVQRGCDATAARRVTQWLSVRKSSCASALYGAKNVLAPEEILSYQLTIVNYILFCYVNYKKGYKTVTWIRKEEKICS